MGLALRIVLIGVVAALAAAVAWRELNVGPSAPSLQSLPGIGPDVDPLAFIVGEDVRIDRDIMDEFDRDRRRRRLRDDRPISQVYVSEDDAAYRQRPTAETALELVHTLGNLSYAQARVRDHRAVLATMERMMVLCTRHRHDAEVFRQCDYDHFYEHRADAHLALGDAAAALADYARAEDALRRAKAESDGTSVGVYDPDWDFWIKFTVAATKAGDTAEAVRVANHAVEHVQAMAVENPSADTLQRRYAWSLNWRGDAHWRAGDRAGAARDYATAVAVLRTYDALLGTFDDLAKELREGPREFLEYRAKVMANPAAADTLERPDFQLSMRAPRRYVGKTKVQRDIGLTLLRLAHARPSQQLEAEIAPIDAELRRRDPGPPSSDEYPNYVYFIHGDARRGTHDLTGAIEQYDAGLAGLHEENAQGDDYSRKIAKERNSRPEAQVIARKGLALIELGRHDEGRRLLDDAIVRFQMMQNETPWVRDLVIDIAWAKELRAAAR